MNHLFTTFLCLCASVVMFAQISGTVVDSQGEPIIGAAVQVKGTTIGTITDFDGNFTIDAAKNATLVVSYLGYTSQEIPLQGKTTVKVTLKEDTQNLDEVVVVG